MRVSRFAPTHTGSRPWRRSKKMAKLEISKVHDAYAAHGECPLCVLVDTAERTYLLSFQGSRVMEPSVRVQTNARGFCAEHYRRLYRGENKLGLGLVVHTHLQEKLPALKRELEGTLSDNDDSHGRRSRESSAERLDALARSLEALRESCFICDMLKSDLDRYTFTIAYLWKGDPEFQETFRASRGFCLSHFVDVLAKARQMLREEEIARFLRDLVPLMVCSLERLEQDLYHFTQLFHDANRGLGSDAERNALARTLQKLAGCLMKAD
jgi:hypothetical protein